MITLAANSYNIIIALMLIAEEMLIHVTDRRDPTYGMLHCIQDTTALPNRPMAVVSLLVDQEALQLQSVNQQ